MTYCDITIKAGTHNLDTDDIETLSNILGTDNISITDCDDYELPQFVLSADVDDILQYITNVEKHGNSYELYCDYHSTIIDANNYESNYRGTFINNRSIAMEYIENLDLELPDIISNNLDYDGIVNDLDYLVIQGSKDLYVFYE